MASQPNPEALSTTIMVLVGGGAIAFAIAIYFFVLR